MKNLLKKFGFQRVIVVVIIAISSIGMWGCYDDPCDDMEYRWTGPTEKKIFGFVNDSFAIVAHANRWSYEADCMCSGERFGLGRWTIGIYNYREQLDGPVFVDSADDGYGQYMYVLGQLSDSVVWGGNTDPNLLVWKNGTSFSFWKIGEQPHVINISSNFDGCSVSFPIASLREWRDGSIFAKGPLTAGNDSCQYAVLDTVSGVLTYKRLDENLMWIQGCDDVRAFGDNVYCLKTQKQPIAVLLLVNEFVVDSIDYSEWHSEYLPYRVVEFDGGMVRIQSKIYGLDLKKNKIKNEPNVLFSSKIEFMDINGNMVSY